MSRKINSRRAAKKAVTDPADRAEKVLPISEIDGARISRTEPLLPADQRAMLNQQLRVSRQSNWINGVAATVNLFALLGVVASLRLSRIATNAAVQQAITGDLAYQASNRPWLSIEARSTKLIYEPGGFMFEPTEFAIKNYGHTVATHVHFRGELINLGDASGKPCKMDERDKDLPQSDQGSVVFPDATFKAAFPVMLLRKDLGPSATPNTLILGLNTCVFYMSPLDKSWHMSEIDYFVQPRDIKVIPDAPGAYEISLFFGTDGTRAN